MKGATRGYLQSEGSGFQSNVLTGSVGILYSALNAPVQYVFASLHSDIGDSTVVSLNTATLKILSLCRCVHLTWTATLASRICAAVSYEVYKDISLCDLSTVLLLFTT